jgi:hypothetical protein
MHQNEFAVGSGLYIDFDEVGADADCFLEGGDRILGPFQMLPAMGYGNNAAGLGGARKYDCGEQNKRAESHLDNSESRMQPDETQHNIGLQEGEQWVTRRDIERDHLDFRLLNNTNWPPMNADKRRSARLCCIRVYLRSSAAN